MNKRFIKLFIVFSALFFPAQFINISPIRAQQSFVTVVNPVRSKFFWKNSEALSDQIQLILDKNIPATWLIQYSNLYDTAVIESLKKLRPEQEIGILLEIDEKLASDANTAYLYGDGDWARPDKVFLSGYSPSERLRMIDKMFTAFREAFGYYPKSVGAWYIDSVSLNYLVFKYKIAAVLDCSDQYKTDKYGLWGKPWGNPYYPSRINSFIPAQSTFDKLNVVKLQWAQRDPVLGYGLTVRDSTYSVQANDYLSHNLPLSYFESLVQSYLYGKNRLNQLTIGLEAGQEGSEFNKELQRQLDLLNSYRKNQYLNFVTMSDFANYFKKTYPAVYISSLIEGSDWTNNNRYVYWYSSSYFRAGLILENNNLIIRDLRDYTQIITFPDISANDQEKVLKRFIPSCIDGLLSGNSKLLASGIMKTEVEKKGDSTVIILFKANNSYSQLILDNKSIRLDDKLIFAAGDQINPFDEFNRNIIAALIDRITYSPHNFRGSFRFSKLSNDWYFGFILTPELFAGVYTRPRFVGILKFPFQVLSRFRRLPRYNTDKLIFDLVNNASKCKIKL